MKNVVMLVCFALVWLSKPHYALAQKQLPPQVVILQYHHVANNTPAATSVTPETFRQHMQYLSEHHQVVRLKDAIAAIQNNRPLPENAISITFDDGYENILTNAHPILMEFGFAYTVFINPSSINTLGDQMTWQQVKQMQPLADFANHTLDHLHLLQRLSNENENQWLSRVMANIEDAEQQLLEQLGYSYKWLAYPYGEFNTQLQKALSEAGYIAFGQQSGAVAKHSQFNALPRFPAAGRYANIDTLKVKMSSIAMPVISHSPSGHQRSPGDVMTDFSLSLDGNNTDLNQQQLACFFKGERIVPNVSNNIMQIELEHTFTPGRVRINCTAPSKSRKGRFYWHSVAFFTPTEKGIFLD
ncbi:polysaccharide deacetylase family protein [Glaciecola sp. SC05]|uniref:polysaccharide deacetylase family protein n=1 Tax=Glaciecola sp. SC05 TaxID=1987355 RepID=UPI003528BD30